jgi:hypothetical protein
MKYFLLISLALTACQSASESDTRWRDMFVDISLRHKYEKYACGGHHVQGYSKENDPPAQAHVHPVSQPATYAGQSAGQVAYNQVQELEGKIEVLEEALKSNAATTNQNQTLIVSQIKSLKAEVTQIEESRPIAAQGQSTPPPSGIRIPGNE